MYAYNKQTTRWTVNILGDSLADYYIHCPLSEKIEMMSFYEMMQQYKKVFKTL
jgi:hypothetical protein